ncbi:transposase [Methanobrevibacter oralis]|uniref:transposase n=1 Tax=Methanobrevibacter oralis TaxID=66851 RepID=UPI003744779E
MTHWTKECKNCPVQEYCSKNTTIQNNQRLWKTFPKKNKNAKKNRKPQKPHQKKKSTKIRSKNNRNYHLQNMKQNIHLTKFTTTDLKQINTEFKLYTIRHNLKREYTTK